MVVQSTKQGRNHNVCNKETIGAHIASRLVRTQNREISFIQMHRLEHAQTNQSHYNSRWFLQSLILIR